MSEIQSCVWFRAPLTCLLGSTVVGFIGDPVTIDTVPNILSKNKNERTKQLVVICSLEDIHNAASIALIDGTETIWRSHIDVTGIAGGVDDADLLPRLLIRIRLPLDEIHQTLGECELYNNIISHSGTNDPFNLCPIYDCGINILGMEEPPSGRGFLFSWSVSRKTTDDRFALQEWGMLVSHPCRVIAMSPPERIFHVDGCVPLVECVDAACGRVCLAMLEEIEQCHKMATGSLTPSTALGSLALFGVMSKTDDQPPSCPLEKKRFYEELLRSTKTDFSDTKIFGVELETTCARERSRQDNKDSDQAIAPKIVTLCCQDILARRTEVNGIFRQSGNQGTVRTLRAIFDRGIVPSVFDIISDNYSTVAFLKNYLLSLPSPVIPWELALKLVKATESPEGKPGSMMPSGAVIQELFTGIPPSHLATLREILLVLSVIVQKQDVNSMSAKNLSVCISPCLSFKGSHESGSSSEGLQEELQATGNIIAAFVQLIENAATFYNHLSHL